MQTLRHAVACREPPRREAAPTFLTGICLFGSLLRAWFKQSGCPTRHGLSTGVLDGNRPISPPRFLASGEARQVEVDWPLGQGTRSPPLARWFDWPTVPSRDLSPLPEHGQARNNPSSKGTCLRGSVPSTSALSTQRCRAGNHPAVRWPPPFNPGTLGSLQLTWLDGPATRAFQGSFTPT